MKHTLIWSLCCGLLVLISCRPAPTQSPFPAQTPSPSDTLTLSSTLLPAGTAMPPRDPSPTPTVIPIIINPVPNVFMAQLRSRDAAVMEALLVGTLIVDETDNCLKVQTDDEAEPILVVWQPDYLLHDGDGVLQIVDATGKTVAQVGETISIGGGEQSLTDSLQASLQEPIPANCVAEKIWRMGEFLAETGIPTPTTTAVSLPQPTVSPTLTLTPISENGATSPATPGTDASKSINEIALAESARVQSLAWSPDGKTLAIANSNTLWLYDVDQPTASPRPLAGHDRHITDIDFNLDGTMLASTDAGGGLRLWNMQTEKGVSVLEDSQLLSREGLSFSPDGATLAVGNIIDNGGYVQLIDLKTQTDITTFDLGFPIGDVAFSPDGNSLAIHSYSRRGNQAVSLRNLNSGEEQSFSGTAMAFSPDGDLLALGITRGNYLRTVGFVELFDLVNGERLGTLPRYQRGVKSVAFSPDGTLLATGDGGSIRIWNPQTLTEVMDIRPLISSIGSIGPFAFSPDGSRLAFIDGDTVQLHTLPPDLAANPHPSAIKTELLIVEDFAAYTEEQLQATYSIDDAGGINQGSVRLVQNNDMPVLALDHRSNRPYPDDYVGVERCFVPEQDWQGGQFLEMWVENDEHHKFLTIQIGEESRCAGEAFTGEVWSTSIRLLPGEKRLVNLPLDDRLFFRQTDDSPRQNNQLDLDKIGYFAVGVQRAEGNSGTVELGSVRLWE